MIPVRRNLRSSYFEHFTSIWRGMAGRIVASGGQLEPEPEPVAREVREFCTDPESLRLWRMCRSIWEMFWVEEKVWERYMDPSSLAIWFWCGPSGEMFWADDPDPWIQFQTTDGHPWWWNAESGEWFLL